MDSRVQYLIDRHQELVAERTVWEPLWREIAQYVMPRAQEFNGTDTSGQKQHQKIFDSAPELAMQRCAAAIDSLITPRTQRWHNLQSDDTELNENINVQRYFEKLTDILFRARYRPRANFASQVNNAYQQSIAFGTACLFTDEDKGKGLMYRSFPLSEIFIDQSWSGMVDTVHRKYKVNARQLAQQFGLEKLPPAIQRAMTEEPRKLFNVVHVVQPNTDRKPGSLDYRGMTFSSCYFMPDEQAILEEGGYRTMPYAVSRYFTGAGEVYGRSIAMAALAPTKMLNEMKKTILRGAQRRVRPPLLLQEDGALRPFSVGPDALNYGTLDAQGNPRVREMTTSGDIGLGIDLLEYELRQINEHFLVTLFQILTENPQMTATEAMIRAQEKAALITPPIGRQQGELLGSTIEREIDILGQVKGLLPPMPRELLERAGSYSIEYTSPLNRAMKSEDAIGIMRTLEMLTPWANVDPTVFDQFDPQEIGKRLAEANGMPASCRRDDADIASIVAKRQQQIDMQNMMQAAPMAAQSAKDMAAAQRMIAAGGNAAGAA